MEIRTNVFFYIETSRGKSETLYYDVIKITMDKLL